MTALYMDGFDHYGTAVQGDRYAGPKNMLDGNWSQITPSCFEIGVPIFGPARTGDYCLKSEGNVGIARKVLAANQTVLYASVAFSMDNLPGSDGNTIAILDIRDEGNAVKYGISLNPSGQIQLYSGQKAAIIATTAGSVIKAATWHFLEMKWDTSAGTFTLHLDDPTGAGTPVLTGSIATGFNIRGFGLGRYNTAGVPDTGFLHWDDLFIRNGSGAINNGWLGDRRIATLLPNKDTDVSNWTPSYYKEFGTGIARFAYQIPTANDPINPDVVAYTNDNTGLGLGTGDFTWESFVRLDTLPGPGKRFNFASAWDEAANQRGWRLFLGADNVNGGQLQFDVSTDGLSSSVSTPFQFPWEPVTNVWYHIAISRTAGVLSVWIDGVQLGVNVACPQSIFTTTNLGQTLGGEGYHFSIYQNCVPNTGVIGRYDETRFTVGYGRYTAPFAVPTAAFPRGAGDPHWAQVQLLLGYDGFIVDESQYLHAFDKNTGVIAFIPNDGPEIGVYSTVNKSTPDDNTFITAPLLNATGTYTLTTQPANGTIVTLGTDGTDPAVYKFVTTLADPFDVKIGATAADTLNNLIYAINLDAGEGTLYGAGTLINADVVATLLPSLQLRAEALVAGTGGNSIVSTSTAGSWLAATLTGGTSIPGPTVFRFQRPPSNTTVLSALQTVTRAFKTDSGLGSIQTAFIGPLGAVANGTEHPLTISTDYYNDIIETDPDTSGPLSPTTIINGKFKITRTV